MNIRDFSQIQSLPQQLCLFDEEVGLCDTGQMKRYAKTVALYISKTAVPKCGVLRVRKPMHGKGTESWKQSTVAGCIVSRQKTQRKRRKHARVMPKQQQNGLRIASEVQMLPACLTACTWQKNSALAATSTETKHKNKKITGILYHVRKEKSR